MSDSLNLEPLQYSIQEMVQLAEGTEFGGYDVVPGVS